MKPKKKKEDSLKMSRKLKKDKQNSKTFKEKKREDTSYQYQE